jgi:hypothetical protein
LFVNGLVSSYKVVIWNHVVQIYESLFSEQCDWRPRLDNLAFDSLDADEVVKGMNKDKAPGPDGFSMAFFQDC